MASGDTLLVLTPAANVPPSSNYMTFDTRNGHAVLDADDTTDESAIFPGVLPAAYSGGGLTVTIVWMATSATSGAVIWEASIERHEDDAVDLDADSFAAANFASGTAASASGEPQYTDVTFADGADMDSLAAGESFRLKISRDADGTNGTDDMSGDAELMRVIIKET